ncbi:uncharacterized protein BDV14DRAFT_196468 [Aspergillus stella-maris]|uniref:uncharacterized protein n=1 Tax=Aspergillus stella-maris TaxID=1810926 RepID=UPI003CCD37FB
MPRQIGTSATFSTDCIETARSALEAHQAVIQELSEKASSSVLFVYVNWQVSLTILFTPFVPFIVLFCHSIETGDEKDLTQMQHFVTLIKSTAQHSLAIDKHHRLFQVFYGVAVKYNELKSRSSSSCSATAAQDELEYTRVRSEVDAQLHALGLQFQPSAGPYELLPPVGSAQTQISQSQSASGYVERHAADSRSNRPHPSGPGHGQQAAALEGWVGLI